MPNWEEIVAKESPRVWGKLWRLLGNRSDVDDCFQETFMSAYRVSQREHVDSWPLLLSKLATARAMDHLRKRYRNKSDPSVDDALTELPLTGDCEVESGLPGPPDSAEATELVEALRWALTQLSGDQAEVFVLQVIDGWSRREIARHLAMSENAVGVMLHRARKKLRILLEEFNEPSYLKTNTTLDGESL